MQHVMTVLANKQQSFAWAILLTGVATTGTGLGGIVRVNPGRYRTRERGLVADQRMQFGKGPLGINPVGFALLDRDRLCALPVLLAAAFSAPGTLPNIGQLL